MVMPPIDLASARGTKVRDIAVDHRPSTGRGKKLTLAQENVLRILYQQELLSLPQGEQPMKKFWVNLASRFREHTHREYSWLSVKRRAEAWCQKSPERYQQLNTSGAGKLNDRGFLAEADHQAIACDTPELQAPCKSPRLAQSRDRRSPQPRDHDSPGVSVLSRSSLNPWTQRNWHSDITDLSPRAERNIRSPRMPSTRPRSRSPQRASQPRYRNRSPSSTRRIGIVSRRLHYQSASGSHEKAPSSPDRPSNIAHEDMSFDTFRRQEFPGLKLAGQLVEDKNKCHLARDPTRPESKDRPASPSLLESPQLSEPDDLPLAPARIRRRHIVSKR